MNEYKRILKTLKHIDKSGAMENTMTTIYKHRDHWTILIICSDEITKAKIINTMTEIYRNNRERCQIIDTNKQGRQMYEVANKNRESYHIIIE